MVGIKMKLQMSNAGGANMKAAASLIYNKYNSLPPGKPKLDCVRYINPMVTNRYIYISPCSVHTSKTHRNQLCSRDLFNRGHCISFTVIQDLYHHLKSYFDNSMNVHQLRHMSRSVAFPDHFSCQNVSFAKQPFEEETIAYQCQWLANKMNYPAHFFDELMEEYRNKDGYNDELLGKKWSY